MLSSKEIHQALQHAFPKAAQYDPTWIRENSIGENVLYNLESLTQVMEIRPGMRVLDLACGKAISAVFLAKEYDVQVWAVDGQVSATENYRRMCQSECENKVFPLRIDARQLPFPDEFFDFVIVIDSYTYFGTDDKYLAYISRFLKPGGYIGIADICFTREIVTFREVPDFLKKDYQSYWYFVHSLDWWRKLWERTGLVSITGAEILPQAEGIRQAYIEDYKQSKREPFKEALEHDDENLISFFRLIGQRTKKEPKKQ